MTPKQILRALDQTGYCRIAVAFNENGYLLRTHFPSVIKQIIH